MRAFSSHRGLQDNKMRVLIVCTAFLAYARAAPSHFVPLTPLSIRTIPYPAVPFPSAVSTISSGDIQAAAIDAQVKYADLAQAAVDKARLLSEQTAEGLNLKTYYNVASDQEKISDALWATEDKKWQSLDAIRTAEAQWNAVLASNAPALSKNAIAGSYVAAVGPYSAVAPVAPVVYPGIVAPSTKSISSQFLMQTHPATFQLGGQNIEISGIGAEAGMASIEAGVKAAEGSMTSSGAGVNAAEASMISSGAGVKAAEASMISTGLGIQSAELSMTSADLGVQAIEPIMVSTGASVKAAEGSITSAGLGGQAVEGSMTSAGLGAQAVESSLASVGAGVKTAEASMASTGFEVQAADGSMTSAGLGVQAVEQSMTSTGAGAGVVEASMKSAALQKLEIENSLQSAEAALASAQFEADKAYAALKSPLVLQTGRLTNAYLTPSIYSSVALGQPIINYANPLQPIGPVVGPTYLKTIC